MNYIDTHTHSEFSPDSRMEMEKAIQQSINLGLGGIIFTDHYDIDVPEGVQPFLFDPDAQQAMIDQMRKKYKQNIFKGIELGLQMSSLDKIENFISGYRFDNIIASVHFVNGIDPYTGDYYQRYAAKTAYINYLECTFNCISAFNNFDVLGHFDYIIRYSPYKEKSISYKDYSDYLDPILKKLAQEGKALEVNTNTYRERLGVIPSLDINILKRFKELGGEAITIGSDAHDISRIGENFDQMSRIIYQSGFRRLTYFKERLPVFTNIS